MKALEDHARLIQDETLTNELIVRAGNGSGEDFRVTVERHK